MFAFSEQNPFAYTDGWQNELYVSAKNLAVEGKRSVP